MSSTLLSRRITLILGLFFALATLGIIACAAEPTATPVPPEEFTLQFTDAGELVRPAGWREWVYIGTPLTPNSLNEPEAAFPEFHSVYIDPQSWEEWKSSGQFREGTILAKELSLIGDTSGSSGNGFFMGELQGFEIAYKSNERFPNEPGGWAYFTFGHRAEPYDATTAAQPTAACSACHTSFAADDMVFAQYYPVLRAAKGTGEAGAGIGGSP